MAMDWRCLLSTRRLGVSTEEPIAVGRSPFQKDMDRIVFSSAFRRLQDKTQVHTFVANDYIRTRLTHSMEVASVGRSLGAVTGHHVVQRADLPAMVTAADFGHIVAAACLAHDIGNPPFGHFGETTIRNWFAETDLGRQAIADLIPAERQDFLAFEGNAQGFRVLSRLQNWRDQGGLQLTCATLATFMKYPRTSLIADADAAKTDSGGRKFGILQAELENFRTVAAATGLVQIGDGAPNYWCRHPLTYLVEAADDICYKIVDLEDGFKLGRIAFTDAEALLMDLAGKHLRRYRQIDDQARKIAYLRAKAIGNLIDSVAEQFSANETAILAGRYRGELLNDSPAASTLAEIYRLTERRVFQTAERFENELQGASALRGLLDHFVGELLQAETIIGGVPAIRLPAGHPWRPWAAPSSRPLGRYHWLLNVTDHISGMTDSYALQQHQALDAPAPAGENSR